MITAAVFVYWPEEEDLIEGCLTTLKWADEIIVIDNGATEKTLVKVKKFTKKIFPSETSDFASRHNLAREKATGDWIIYVDADERVSKELADEITHTLKNPQADAYQLRRVNYFLGKKVRFGDRYPDYVTRLFKKDSLKGWSGEIHESSEVSGSIGVLSAPLYHFTHRDIYSMVRKTINFSEHEARLRFKAGHPQIVGWRLLRVTVTEAFTRLIKYQGVRQGTEGWIDGLFQALSMFVVYARLWELQRKPQLSETYKELDDKITKEFSS